MLGFDGETGGNGQGSLNNGSLNNVATMQQIPDRCDEEIYNSPRHFFHVTNSNLVGPLRWPKMGTLLTFNFLVGALNTEASASQTFERRSGNSARFIDVSRTITKELK